MVEVTRTSDRVEALIREANVLVPAVRWWCTLIDCLGAELEAAVHGAPDEDAAWDELVDGVGMRRVWDLRLFLAGVALGDSDRPTTDFLEEIAERLAA